MEGMLNYFIAEDGDTSDHMNVVPLPRVETLRLQHIKKSFPLPGEFHFRFKTAFEGTYVWLDVTNDADVIPDYNGLVVSKISRVQRANHTRPAERVPAPKPATPKATQPEPDLFQTSTPSSPKREEPVAPAKTFNDDLVGLLADPVPVPVTSPRGPAPPSNASPAPIQTAPGAQDPFHLFMGAAGSTGASMRPSSAPMNAPRGPVGPGNAQAGPGGYGGVPGNGFAPMGGSGGPGSSPMGSRVPGNINISQMGHHMGMNQPGPGPTGNSFSGLQWQGMGSGGPAPQQQQQQPRPMGMGGAPNSNGRQW